MSFGKQAFSAGKSVRKLYYLIREWLPVSVRRQLQQIYLRDWKELPFPAWPVDFTVDNLHQEFLRLLMASERYEQGALHLVLARRRAQLLDHDS